jgi:MSHA biogenesis protein MshQ
MQIQVLYTMPLVLTPGAFNAFETSTAANATTGVVTTKVSGTAFSLDVVVISGGVQYGNFTDNVTVELLGNTTLGVALDAQNCPTSSTLIQTVTPAAIASGRSTVAFSAVSNTWRDVRVRVSYPTGSPTVIACSTDNFAVRPASFTVAATDATWQTEGNARTLNATTAAGNPVHKAGRPFRLTVTPSPGTTTNYAGDPTVSSLTCTLPGTCANGTLTVGGFSGGGTRTSTTASYSEVGAFNVTLVDQDWASVDAADTAGNCTATGRYVCHSGAPLAVGRFVPDHFAVTAGTAPVMRTFNTTGCAPRTFTYIGQSFGYDTVPISSVVAQDFNNNTTSNYRGTLWKLTNASASQSFSNSPVMGITPSIGTPTLTEIANTGTGTLTANSADTILFTRATPIAPFTANLSLTVSVSDATEADGTISTTTPLVYNGSGSGVAFDSGAEFRFGRLRVPNVNGSQLTALAVPIETQYANAALAFITNTADNCTSIANNTVAMTFTGNISPAPNCKTAVNGGGTFTSGRRTLVLSPPGSGNDGAAVLSVNLNGAAGTTCSAVGAAPAAAANANRPYLQGNWSGGAWTVNPSGRASFGVFRGSDEVIFIRENF